MSKDKPQIMSAKIISESRCFKVEEVKLEFSNGVQRVYERLVDQGLRSVMVVAMLDSERFLLIHEYAVGREDYILTLPAGSVDPGETYEDAANRELMEETGYGARRLTHLGELTTVPGHLQHTINIVLAEDLYEKRLDGDEPELLTVEEANINDLHELLRRPDFHESRAISAIVMAKQQLLDYEAALTKSEAVISSFLTETTARCMNG